MSAAGDKRNKTPKRQRGRPSTYTPELGSRICERVALCEPLSKIVAEKDMPSMRTIYAWQREHEDFAKALSQAREHRADARADAIHDLIEQVKAGTLDAHAGRVAIEGHRWLASREQPRKYGERVMSEVAIHAHLHSEHPSETKAWIEKILAGDDRTNVIPLLPLKDPAA